MQKISKKSLIFIALIALFGILSYSNSLSVPFIFDDLHSILYSQDIQNKDITHIWNTHTTRFIPLATFALQSSSGVAAYHIVNITIHLITASIIYIFALLLFRHVHQNINNSELQAFFVSALFALHPIQTQAVTYISQRTVLFATLFYVSTLAFYVYGRITAKQWSIGLAFLCTLIAMLTKEITVTIPLTIAVLEFTIFQNTWTKTTWKTHAIRIAIFLTTLAIIPITLFVTRGYVSTLPASIATGETSITEQGAHQDEQLVLPQKEYALTQLTVIPTYLQLLLFPYNLNIDHDTPTQRTLFAPRTLASAVVILTLLFIGLRTRKRLPILSFGILFFFIALSLESSIFPIEDVMFEHRVYLPSIGFFLAVISLAYSLPLTKKYSKQVAIVLTIVSIALAYGTYQRNTIWQNPIRLWSDAAAKSPQKVRPQYNLAWAYMEEGNQNEAVSIATTILSHSPNHALSMNLLGLGAYKDGNYQRAEEYFKQAISLQPKLMSLRGNLGSMLGQAGKISESIQVSLDALAIDPHYIDARINLAAAYTRQARYNEAIAEYLIIIKENPRLSMPYRTLADIYAQQGNYQQAAEMRSRALMIDQGK